ncbi:hypothetical protein A8B79_05860 [Balneola sp. EhC07]|uniref:prepilin peptidase n=1 Tax=Balneola sp. EhC07 TaxID=1849360 RepID=UPI0007F4526A|nr:A24 family peptidase [Balneola sp. EhC07]OAN61000.1 hypothetical protein A8B79_05860 [Balneola sp. EhC07]
MLLTGLIAVFLGLLGGYLCFFKPSWLSKNINELPSEKAKWTWNITCIILVLVLSFIFTPESSTEWLYFIFVVILFFGACVDTYSYIIPNKLLVVGSIIALLNVLIVSEYEPIVALLSVLVLGGLVYYLMVQVLGKKAFGLGDLKLISLLALFLGWEFLWVLYIAVVLGGVFALIGVLFKKLNRKSRIPFAPFVFLALFINYLAPDISFSDLFQLLSF